MLERQSLQQNGAGNTRQQYVKKKKKSDHSSTPYTKISSKCSTDLNGRSETRKLLEENIGRTLSDINHSKILYDLPPRVMEIKENKQMGPNYT